VEEAWRGPAPQLPGPRQHDDRGHEPAGAGARHPKGRSGGQWDIWQAVYSPVGDDGYPKPIWDKRTGVIDREVAAHWRENYDLSHILRRDWEQGLGPKLRGKIHIYVGDMDNYYLNNAVYLVEEFLKSTTDPPYEGRSTTATRARALLERRPHAAERHLAAALPPDVRAEDPPGGRPRRFDELFHETDGLPEGASAVIAPDGKGACPFFEGEGDRTCALQRQAGEQALPSACRQYPRICLADARGISATLSHYCPTAASLLFRADVALGVVANGPAFPPGTVYEGLAASEEYPPLLCPTILFDLETYDAWERHMVSTCARAEASPETVIRLLARSANELAAWRPGRRPLADHAREVFEKWQQAAADEADDRRALSAAVAAHARACEFVPPGLQPPSLPAGFARHYDRWVSARWLLFDRPIKHYLAARGFASWLAYQGRGVRTIVAGMEMALGVLKVEAARQCALAQKALDRMLLLEAFRSSDLLLVHLAAPLELARGLSEVAEAGGPKAPRRRRPPATGN
jgi:hypothetical protein